MSRLEKAAHFCLIAVSCMAFAVLAQRYSAQRSTSSPIHAGRRATVSRPVEVGDRFNLPGVEWNPERASVVIGFRSDCQYCIASLPFYRRVAEVRKKYSSSVGLYALSTDSPEVSRKFLARAGVTVDRVIQRDLATLGLQGTPTILVLDGNGRIVKKFVGKLTESSENTLLSIMGSPETPVSRISN